MHRHQWRRHAPVDGRARQHGALLGPPRGTTTAPARLLQSDLLARILSHWFVVGGGHGELPRGSTARGQAGPLPAPAARVLRAVAQVRGRGEVVRLHREG